VDFALTTAQRSWREEVLDFLGENLTPAVQAEFNWGFGEEGGGSEVKKFRRLVAEKGWFGLNWPPEYGGQKRSAVEQLIMLDEFEYVGAPPPEITVRSIGPTIIHYGTEANRDKWLPAIASGEMTCALGYSEPDAGSDLASLTTRADLDGDEWVINGAKIWNSAAHFATHEWLAVRTSREDRKHLGISVIVVPMGTPGMEVQPIHTWAGLRTNALFLNDVRVPRDHLIGDAGRGWTYITGALAFERGSLGRGQLRRMLDDLISLCRQPVGGRRLIDQPSTRRRLAELEVDMELARLLSFQTTALMDQNQIPTLAATKEKIAVCELRIKLADWATQIVGLPSLLTTADPAAPLAGLLEQRYRQSPLFFFVGGANDVLRDVIARGHGLPRSAG
jgi:alkylation response protein AidB-like acyl-CoA dehydrogenase